MNKRLGLSAWFILLCVFLPNHSIAASVVVKEVTSYQQGVDEHMPWQRKPLRKKSFLAVDIGNGQYLTSTQTLQQHRFIELLSPDKDNERLQVIYKDDRLQLAILGIEKARSFTKLPFLLEQKNIVDKQARLIYSWRQKKQFVKKLVQEVQPGSSLGAAYAIPLYRIDSGTKRISAGAALVKERKLAGLVARITDKTALVVPGAIIASFLQDFTKQSSKRQGYSKLGVAYRPLVDRYLRQHLGLESLSKGVWVDHIQKSSNFYDSVKSGDVLLKVGDFDIDGRGYYQDPDFGRQRLASLAWRLPVDKELVLSIWRNGKPLKIKAKLSEYKNRADVLPLLNGEDRPFFVAGGVVFSQLTKNYLFQWGKDWRKKAPIELVHATQEQEQTQVEKIFLSHVFSHEQTRGYGRYKYALVYTLNEKPVVSFESFRRDLKHTLESGEAAVLKLGEDRKMLVLNQSSYNDMNKELQVKFGLDKESFINFEK